MPGPEFLAGETVSLRTIEEEDLDFLQEAVNDPAVWRGIGRSAPVNQQQEESFFEDIVCDEESINLLITVDEIPVGTVGLGEPTQDVRKAELGYWVAPDHHRNGYGSEAAELLVDYGFTDRNLHRIEARAFEFNTGSQRLLEGLGFTNEGALRDAHFAHGEYQDILWYGILAEEWTGRE